jgi:peptidoglycan/LPS O-acetylase OafA/YrhL
LPVDGLRKRAEGAKVVFFFAGLLGYQATQLLGFTKLTWVVTSLGCVMILLATFSSRRLQAFLEIRPLVFLGRISYSVYLLQFITILCLIPPWLHFLNSLGLYNKYLLLSLTLLADVSATLLMAAISYRYVEVPCISLGSWLSKKISRKPKTGPATPTT